MQTMLFVITVGSLLMTIVLAAILVRLIRFERRREAVRVALLREMSDQIADQAEQREDIGEADFQVVQAPNSDLGLRQVIDVPPTPRRTYVREAGDLEIAPVASAGDLFVHSETRSAWPRRAAVAAIVAIAVLGATFALRRAPAATGAGAPAAATATSSPPQALLELVSLKQALDGGALKITGLVHNPQEGAPLSKVVATAMVFGPDGTYLASGRAPLDFTVLRPGDESGFVITVPVDAPVARYRVGFRNEDGHVIGHIDRRSASTLATGTANAAVPARGTS